MSKNYNDCLYQLRCHIINTDSTPFSANMFYNYLKASYASARCFPVTGRIQSTNYDQQLLMIPFECYAVDPDPIYNNSVIVNCAYINGNNIEGTPYDYIQFSCRNAVTNCNDKVITLLDISE